MVNGIFVGIGASGEIVASARTVRYRGEPPIFINDPDIIQFGDPAENPTLVAGYFDLMDEFKDGRRTTRAKDVIARLGTQRFGHNAVAVRYAAYLDAIREWSHDPAIGGDDIATIILERDKGWRWAHRPEFCPEN